MKIMTTPLLCAGLTVFCSLALSPIVGHVTAATPDPASAESVKNLQLRISANGRYFVDQGGKPFFYLGDTCWLLFQRLNREELDEYLKDRVAKGFTVIQAYVLRGLGKQHPDGNSSLLDATPLLDRDPNRPNEEFFKNVDYVVNRANELGLVMGLVTAKSWHVNEQRRPVVSRRRFTSGKIRGGLGGDGERAEGRQRRPPPRLLSRAGEHFFIHMVSRGGLARLQLDPIRASFRFGQLRVRRQGLRADSCQADRGHGAGV
jgi:hypothetical protein